MPKYGRRSEPAAKQCLVMAIGVVGASLLALTGVILLCVGQSTKGGIESLSPMTDFVKMPKGCTIKAIAHDVAYYPPNNKAENGMVGCVDLWAYTFTVGGSATSYLSSKTLVKRNSTLFPTCTLTATPSPQSPSRLGQPGTAVDCWKPARGPGKLSRHYQCSNKACYKFVEPSPKTDAALASAQLLVTLGIVFLSVGVAGCVLWACFVQFCLVRESKLSRDLAYHEGSTRDLMQDDDSDA